MSDTLIAGGHSPATDWDGALTALESRADVDSLEDLHRQRRQLLPEYGVLRALHGPGGKWDARRKAMLEAMKIQARSALTKNGEKVTEAAIDALGHADDRYVQFVEDGIVGATRHIELETLISEIEERIRSREIALLCFNSEAKLQR